jgi:glyoxylase-like metal-dependent hydrolase (beta-lactamase superfamily II)
MVRRVADGVSLLDVSWPEPVGANAYLVDDGEVTLVDAGLPVPRRPLSAELRAAGYHPADIDRVLLTHYDIDHVGGLRDLGVDAPVHLGAADARLVRRSWSPPWTHHKGAFHRVARRLFSLSDVDLRPVEDGDSIGGFRALHTPGHNPGHTVFLHDDSGTALLGDLVWESGGRFLTPPWLDSYDTERMADSIDRVADESFDHACVGHGRPVSPAGDAALRDLAVGL